MVYSHPNVHRSLPAWRGQESNLNFAAYEAVEIPFLYPRVVIVGIEPTPSRYE